MLIQIEPTSSIPIYTQLTHQLTVLIAKEKLKAGDTLPSVRSLAADLGMNMHTVNKSYHELEKKGLIRIVPKSGAVINPIPDNGISPEHRPRIVEELQPIIAEAIALGMSTKELETLTSSIISIIKEDA